MEKITNEVKKGEIVFCDLTIIYKGIKHNLEKVVYKNDGKLFYNKNHLSKLNIKEPVKVEDIKVISRLGFENKTKEFTEVKANTEIRNKITGTYE
tara:strand:+ start:48 stop:332 length:285 start_codon:yes stop_codon:yes gene_type:complete